MGTICDYPGPGVGGRPFCRWWVSIQGKVDDHPLDGGWPLAILSMVSYHPGDDGRPSWGWWVTIYGMVGGHLWKLGYHSLKGG